MVTPQEKFAALEEIIKFQNGEHELKISTDGYNAYRMAGALYNQTYRTKTEDKSVIPITVSLLPGIDKIRTVIVTKRPHLPFHMKNPAKDPFVSIRKSIANLIPGQMVEFSNLTPEQVQSIRVFCSKKHKGGFMVGVVAGVCKIYRNDSNKENFSKVLLERTAQLAIGDALEIPANRLAYARSIVSTAYDPTKDKFRFEKTPIGVFVRRVTPIGFVYGQ